jgi:hypothetical protein
MNMFDNSTYMKYIIKQFTFLTKIVKHYSGTLQKSSEDHDLIFDFQLCKCALFIYIYLSGKCFHTDYILIRIISVSQGNNF